MATIVFFHAHPDDECMLTGGTMAKLAANGHRVVLVVATRGERGEVADGVLAPDESLGQHRSRELERSAAALKVARVAFLGYVGGEDLPEFDVSSFGVPGELVTTRVDVSGYVDAKRQAMVCHASQISDVSWALELTPERFARAFAQEQYTRRDAPRGTVETELFLPAL
jgi:LmbE family N-acetylglucosaminyl deacetylase